MSIYNLRSYRTVFYGNFTLQKSNSVLTTGLSDNDHFFCYHMLITSVSNHAQLIFLRTVFHAGQIRVERPTCHNQGLLQ